MEDQANRYKALIGKTLIAGVVLAGILVGAGGIRYLLHFGADPVHYHVFRGVPDDLRTVHGILHKSEILSGRGIIQMGLILLIGLQLLRVGLTVWVFHVLRDPAFVAISLLILGVLGFSLFGYG
jgi:uncharacterized membrane protein